MIVERGDHEISFMSICAAESIPTIVDMIDNHSIVLNISKYGNTR